jgi:hypothetical protein
MNLTKASTRTAASSAQPLDTRAWLLERAKDPRSLVLVPRTPEGRLLCHLVVSLDRAVYRLRRNAGLSIPLPEAANWLTKVQQLLSEWTTVLTMLGIPAQQAFLEDGMSLATESFKTTLLQNRNARVLLPRDRLLRDMAIALQRLDGALFAMRLTSPDLVKAQAAIEAVGALIRQMHELVDALSAAVHVPYTPPKLLTQRVSGSRPSV